MINEVDIQDYKNLYDLPYGAYFKLAEEPHVPPVHDPVNPLSIFKFLGIDGMYSKIVNKQGELLHFAAWTKVIPVEGWDN
jgi:hypothetical protein